jgi:hypothetical protein
MEENASVEPRKSLMAARKPLLGVRNPPAPSSATVIYEALFEHSDICEGRVRRARIPNLFKVGNPQGTRFITGESQLGDGPRGARRVIESKGWQLAFANAAIANLILAGNCLTAPNDHRRLGV